MDLPQMFSPLGLTYLAFTQGCVKISAPCYCRCSERAQIQRKMKGHGCEQAVSSLGGLESSALTSTPWTSVEGMFFTSVGSLQ